MRDRGWSSTVLSAAGVGLLAMGLVRPAAAGEPSDGSVLAIRELVPGAVQTTAALGAEGAVGEAPPPGGSESPSLPTPAEDVELPEPGDGLLDGVVEAYVVKEPFGISLAPRPLRRPRGRPY